MKPFYVLVTTTFIAIILLYFIDKTIHLSLAARIGICVMFLFTAMGHFMFTEGMALMIPKIIPYKKEIVYITGIIEIMGAIALLFPKLTRPTAWLLIVFLIILLPGNIYGAIHQVDYQNATYQGKGLSYLFLRIPLQVVYILWLYFSSIKPL